MCFKGFHFQKIPFRIGCGYHGCATYTHTHSRWVSLATNIQEKEMENAKIHHNATGLLPWKKWDLRVSILAVSVRRCIACPWPEPNLRPCPGTYCLLLLTTVCNIGKSQTHCWNFWHSFAMFASNFSVRTSHPNWQRPKKTLNDRGYFRPFGLL